MKQEIFTICDNAQAYGDKLIIIGPFAKITGKAFPVSRPGFSIALRLRYTPDEYGTKEYVLGIKKPDGNDLVSPIQTKFNAEFNDDKLKLGVLNLNVNLPPMQFMDEGEYTVYFEGEGDRLTQTFVVSLD